MAPKFVGFLKTFGVYAARVAGIVTGFAPEVEAAVKIFEPPAKAAKIDADISEASSIMTTVMNQETAFTAAYGAAQTGPQKAAAVAALIAPDIQATAARLGATPVDAALANAALQVIAGGYADYLNACKPVAK